MSSDNTVPPENTIVEKSFIINDDTFNDNKQSITTDFYTAIIYLHRFERTQMNGGYIKIPYFMPSGTMRPNATYMADVNTRKYKCVNLYIFKATHNIKMDAMFDAELVIELVPTVNTSEKLYLCFLLSNTRYTNSEPNAVDDIINSSIKPPMHYTTMNFDFQKLIEPNQKKIIYKSGIDTVIIFLSPIKINEVNFSSYEAITDGLFSMYPVNNDYKIIVPPKIEGFTEGNSNQSAVTISKSEISNALGDQLLTCEPVDDNDQSLVNDNTVTYLADGSKDAVSKSAAFVFGLSNTIIAIVLAGVLCPLIFRFLIAGYITDGRRLTLFAVFIFIMLFVLSLILLLGGMKYDSTEALAGGYILVVLLISCLTIPLSRYTFKSMTANVEMSGDYMEVFRDAPSALYHLVICFYREKCQPETFDRLPFFGFIGVYIVMMLIICIVGYLLTATPTWFPAVMKKEKEIKGYTSHLQNLIISIGAIYGFIILLWIVMLIKSNK